MPEGVGKGKYWDNVEDDVPVQAPRKAVFDGKFQYFIFDDPPDLTDDRRRTLGFYNHAYAPIGNENALYTPMPRDMLEKMKFEYVLLPNGQKMMTNQYITRCKPLKTYMSLAYFQELFRGTLPQSYGDPKKKSKPGHQDMEMEPEM